MTNENDKTAILDIFPLFSAHSVPYSDITKDMQFK